MSVTFCWTNGDLNKLLLLSHYSQLSYNCLWAFWDFAQITGLKMFEVNFSSWDVYFVDAGNGTSLSVIVKVTQQLHKAVEFRLFIASLGLLENSPTPRIGTSGILSSDMPDYATICQPPGDTRGTFSVSAWNIYIVTVTSMASDLVRCPVWDEML